MKVLNLSKGTRMISLANNDIIIKPESISKEFSCSTKLFRTLTSTKNYQNVFRFIMDASERSMLDLVPCIPSLIISIQEAKDLLEFVHEGGVPAQLDIHGNIIASKIMPKKSVDCSDEPQEVKQDPEPEIDQDEEGDKEPQPMTDEEIAKMAKLHKVEEDPEPEEENKEISEDEVKESSEDTNEIAEVKEESTHTSSSSSSSHQKRRRRRK